MKFKLDENLPVELAELLRLARHDALTIIEQRLRGTKDKRIAEICKREDRIIVTLDLDFSNIREYVPSTFPGIVILRPYKESKQRLIHMFARIIPMMTSKTLRNRLWIVEETRIRIHES